MNTERGAHPHLLLSQTTDVIAAALIVYRLAHMIANEGGPWDVFHWTRQTTAHQFPGWIADGIACQLCSSFWLSVLVVPLFPSLRSRLWCSIGTVAGLVLVIDRQIYVR